MKFSITVPYPGKYKPIMKMDVMCLSGELDKFAFQMA